MSQSSSTELLPFCWRPLSCPAAPVPGMQRNAPSRSVAPLRRRGGSCPRCSAVSKMGSKGWARSGVGTRRVGTRCASFGKQTTRSGAARNGTQFSRLLACREMTRAKMEQLTATATEQKPPGLALPRARLPFPSTVTTQRGVSACWASHQHGSKERGTSLEGDLPVNFNEVGSVGTACGWLLWLFDPKGPPGGGVTER